MVGCDERVASSVLVARVEVLEFGDRGVKFKSDASVEEFGFGERVEKFELGKRFEMSGFAIRLE